MMCFSLVYDRERFLDENRCSFRFYGIGFCYCAGQTGVMSVPVERWQAVRGER